MILPKVKAKSLSTLEHELDLIFGQYISLRDYNNGWKCFICGVRIPSKSYGQVCHFIPRAKMPTRYDEMNCNFGCIDCNCFDREHQLRYESAMVGAFGWSLTEALKTKSQGLQKFMRCDIVDLIDLYKTKVSELKKLKGL
jgi:hypothetical protein